MVGGTPHFTPQNDPFLVGVFPLGPVWYLPPFWEVAPISPPRSAVCPKEPFIPNFCRRLWFSNVNAAKSCLSAISHDVFSSEPVGREVVDPTGRTCQEGQGEQVNKWITTNNNKHPKRSLGKGCEKWYDVFNIELNRCEFSCQMIFFVQRF